MMGRRALRRHRPIEAEAPGKIACVAQRPGRQPLALGRRSVIRLRHDVTHELDSVASPESMQLLRCEVAVGVGTGGMGALLTKPGPSKISGKTSVGYVR